MLREIINPKSNQIVITLPPELVNQDLELLIFPTKKNKKYDTKKLMECVFKNAETTDVEDSINISSVRLGFCIHQKNVVFVLF
ncbi:hypothetical protein [Desulfobacter postgatei]|uniref:hypothetical protein n=1 Tax=Desulfobacter postgatei TaxID=2293 RepID=UPI00259B19DB|nr:hypothetical protein [uncultured Desulfobacter sp.]